MQLLWKNVQWNTFHQDIMALSVGPMRQKCNVGNHGIARVNNVW